MSINKAFAVSIEANRKKQEIQGKAVLFCEAERFSNRYPKRNAIMKTLWGVSFSNAALFFGRGGIKKTIRSLIWLSFPLIHLFLYIKPLFTKD